MPQATAPDPDELQSSTPLAVATGASASAGWKSLFFGAFRRSKNGMVLLDERRRHVDVNGAYLGLLGYQRRDVIGRPVFEFVIGGPFATEREWRAMLHQDHFTGVADLRRKDGGQVKVEFAGHSTELMGNRFVLAVALATTRRGRRFTVDHDALARSIPLSKRELQIVQLIALGSSGPEIADELHLTHNTVRTHVRNAMNKLGTRSRAQMVAKLLGEGLYWDDRP